jgi:hypothetical protein
LWAFTRSGAARYNNFVARGWESKSVESQVEARETARSASTSGITPEQAARERQFDSLLLHRTRVLGDLARCQEERYRKTLSDGLTFLESQLTTLGWRRNDD